MTAGAGPLAEFPAVVQWVAGAGGLLGIAAVLREGYTIIATRRQAGEARANAATAADTAADDRWRRMLETQTEALLQPLTEELGRLSAKVEAQDRKIAELDRKLDATTRKYRLAISTLRLVYAWVAEHFPGHTPPPVPHELAHEV